MGKIRRKIEEEGREEETIDWGSIEEKRGRKYGADLGHGHGDGAGDRVGGRLEPHDEVPQHPAGRQGRHPRFLPFASHVFLLILSIALAALFLVSFLISTAMAL